MDSSRSRGARRRYHYAILTAALLLLAHVAGSVNTASAAEERIAVCPTCAITTPADAIAQAPPGARIEVHAGRYDGPITIDRPVALIGIDQPEIVGDGTGTVVRITAPDVRIEGFTIRGTGTSLDHEDTAILVEAPGVTLVGNTIEDALFGIYLKNAPRGTLQNNVVQAKALPIARRGDGIRIWYSDDVVVDDNTARDGRDVILWYSNRCTVRNNAFDRGRYGLHLMFSDDARIDGNSLRSNSIGLYIMYSRNAVVTGNWLSDNHGPSGGGLGVKDVDGLIVEGNRFVNNRYGAQLDNSPREQQIEHSFRGNVFAFNGVAVGMLPNVRSTTFSANTFDDNVENVAILGGGVLRDVRWQGNYWSDYAGFDADRDGIGDRPYQSQRFFESVTDRHPSLNLFLYSPASIAVDFAARAFPVVQPTIKLEDPAPLVRPPAFAMLPGPGRLPAGARLMLVALGAVAVIAALAVIRRLQRSATPVAILGGRGVMTMRAPFSTNNHRVPPAEVRIDMASSTPPPAPSSALVARNAAEGTTTAPVAQTAITVAQLTKRYGKQVAVKEATFQIRPGEAVALWGPNGAGKTTILRCLLGVTDYAGDVQVFGLRPDRDGRAVRARTGFVPQEMAATQVTVREMAALIARLKHASTGSAIDRLRRLGIEEQLDKKIAALSGGMKQRLALALALIGEPSLLLLDEPTANLDAAGRTELIEILQQFKRKGMTLLFSSHRPDDVLLLADRVLIMRDGLIERELTPGEFRHAVGGSAYLTLFLAHAQAEEAAGKLHQLGYQSRATSDSTLLIQVPSQHKAQVIEMLMRAGIVINDFEVEQGSWNARP